MRFDSFPSRCDEALGERRGMVRPGFRGCQPVIRPAGWRVWVRGRVGWIGMAKALATRSASPLEWPSAWESQSASPLGSPFRLASP